MSSFIIVLMLINSVTEQWWECFLCLTEEETTNQLKHPSGLRRKSFARCVSEKQIIGPFVSWLDVFLAIDNQHWHEKQIEENTTQRKGRYGNQAGWNLMIGINFSKISFADQNFKKPIVTSSYCFFKTLKYELKLQKKKTNKSLWMCFGADRFYHFLVRWNIFKHFLQFCPESN